MQRCQAKYWRHGSNKNRLFIDDLSFEDVSSVFFISRAKKKAAKRNEKEKNLIDSYLYCTQRVFGRENFSKRVWGENFNDDEDDLLVAKEAKKCFESN